MNQPPFKFPKSGLAIDLFAGAGGASLGMRRAGYQVALAVELDPHAALTYRSNHSATLTLEKDIRDVDPREAARAARIPPGNLTIMNACPPCQGFSTLYKGKTLADRNDLVLTTATWAKALSPHIILMENVPGLARDGRFSQLVRSLRSIGYGVQYWMIDAAKLGVPQHRKRLIMIATKGIPKGHLPEDLIAITKPAWRRRSHAYKVLRNLQDLTKEQDPLHIARRKNPLVKARIEAIPPNGTRFDLPDHLVLDCHRKIRNRCAAGSYARVPLSGPSATLTTRCTTPSCGPFIHPVLNRGLTLREAATLQTFPRTYNFFGCYEEIERQIGNAIPPRLTERILRTLQGIAKL